MNRQKHWGCISNEWKVNTTGRSQIERLQTKRWIIKRSKLWRSQTLEANKPRNSSSDLNVLARLYRNPLYRGSLYCEDTIVKVTNWKGKKVKRQINHETFQFPWFVCLQNLWSPGSQILGSRPGLPIGRPRIFRLKWDNGRRSSYSVEGSLPIPSPPPTKSGLGSFHLKGEKMNNVPAGGIRGESRPVPWGNPGQNPGPPRGGTIQGIFRSRFSGHFPARQA